MYLHIKYVGNISSCFYLLHEKSLVGFTNPILAVGFEKKVEAYEYFTFH